MRICISINALSQVSVGAPSHDWPTETAGTISYPIAAVGAAIAAPDRPLLCPHADTSAMDTMSGCAHRRGKTSTSPPSPNDNGAFDTVRIELHRVALPVPPVAVGQEPPPLPPSPSRPLVAPFGLLRPRRPRRGRSHPRPSPPVLAGVSWTGQEGADDLVVRVTQHRCVSVRGLSACRRRRCKRQRGPAARHRRRATTPSLEAALHTSRARVGEVPRLRRPLCVGSAAAL